MRQRVKAIELPVSEMQAFLKKTKKTKKTKLRAEFNQFEGTCLILQHLIPDN